MTKSIIDYERIQYAQYRFIRDFAVHKSFSVIGEASTSIRLELMKQIQSEGATLTFWASEVSSLRVGNLNGTVGVLLTVRDVRLEQLENSRFRVIDEELGIIRFDCQEFDFEITS